MKRVLLIVLGVCCMVYGIYAIPARKRAIVKTQPDGTEVTVYQHGDEHFHWVTNERGEWLQRAEDGFYRVSEALSEGEIAAKRMAAVRDQQRVVTELNIAPRGLVILVNFQDVAFKTEKAEMDSMLMGKNYVRDYSYVYEEETIQVKSKGSARQYFYESSNGQYNPHFDVVGPVTVSEKMVYYGKNNKYGNDSKPYEMVKEACLLVDDSVDFAQYDNDGDGKVDFVYVIYAGYGEADGADSNTIWPHAHNLLANGLRCDVDGKRVDLYACGNELDFYSDYHTGIGAFCHEFSHVLGLPDLYVTNGGAHKTLGEWSILDYGPYGNEGNTPPTYSAYERFFMGWLTPRLIVDAENVKLEDLKKSNEALLISTTDKHNLKGNDPNHTKFYLLENRQNEGWDAYLPGHGLMMTYVQYSSTKWADNTVNNTASRMGVDLIEADGKAPTNKEDEGYWGKATDLFPAGATEYLNIEEHPIEEIEEKDGVIYFKYKGGKVESATEDVVMNQVVIAIYNILGQKEATIDIETLPRGTYVVVTSAGNHKIIR